MKHTSYIIDNIKLVKSSCIFEIIYIKKVDLFQGIQIQNNCLFTWNNFFLEIINTLNGVNSTTGFNATLLLN